MQWENDLVRDIRLNNPLDDEDGVLPQLGLRWSGSPIEFTEANHNALQTAINSCKTPPRTFMEIGVCRNGDKSSTHTILKNLPQDGIYLGVDIDDKSYLNDSSRGIHTIRTSSSNYEEVVSKLKSLGVDKIDFIFIDGWHSINQVLLDWEYTKILSDGGVVAFHDTTGHPGPYFFIRNMNEDKWVVHHNVCPSDHGFGYCYRKH
jgi:predicted O-methyltransferase YrrM